MSNEYYPPYTATAKLLAEIASIRRYSEEQEAVRAQRAAANATVPQPTSAEIMEAIQRLTDDIMRLRTAIASGTKSADL